MESRQMRYQFYIALHVDVVLDLIILLIFLFIKNLNFLAYLVLIFCPIYAYTAFKRNSFLNHWVSTKLDNIDTAFLRWILKSKNRRKRLVFRKFLPHSELNTIFLDIPLPIDSSKFKKIKKRDEMYNDLFEEDPDPFHINKTTLDLAQQFIEDENSLTKEEFEKLCSDGSYKERELLEAHLPPDHPILLKIDNKLKVEISDGLSILK
ncbi:MAG: hypothetical protein ACTSWX_03170 [Promethearchaeota archaeon]